MKIIAGLKNNARTKIIPYAQEAIDGSLWRSCEETRTGSKLSICGNRLTLSKKRKPASTFQHRERSSIQKFSKSSGYRMAQYLRGCTASYDRLLTFTFDNCPDGQTAMDAFNKWIKRYRREFEDNETKSLFWFKEFQNRGSIHFHAFCNHYISKDWLHDSWLACNPHLKFCRTNIKRIRSGRFGMLKYAAKYAQKQKQKVLPENYGWIGRWWGKIGETTMSAASIEVYESCLMNDKKATKLRKMADFVENRVDEGAIIHRVVEIKDDETGEVIETGIVNFDAINEDAVKQLQAMWNDCFGDEAGILVQCGWIRNAAKSSKFRPP